MRKLFREGGRYLVKTTLVSLTVTDCKNVNEWDIPRSALSPLENGQNKVLLCFDLLSFSSDIFLIPLKSELNEFASSVIEESCKKCQTF